MELVDENVHRALLYVATLNREGYLPTTGQVEAFATSAGPRPAAYTSTMAELANTARQVAQGGRHLVREAEPVTEYLHRVGWIATGHGGLRLTDCGEALLRGLGRSEAEDSEAVEVTLEPKDPLVYVQLTRLVGAAGSALLVDAYFKPDYVPWLVKATQVARLLVGAKHPQAPRDLQSLGLALGGLGKGRDLEVRATKDPRLHDRCLISPTGRVSVMGTSVNGVGQSLTAVVPLSEEAARVYRKLYEDLWREAEAVKPLTITAITHTDAASDANGEATSSAPPVRPESSA